DRVLVVQASTVAVDEAALRRRDQLAQRRHPVLERHQRTLCATASARSSPTPASSRRVTGPCCQINARPAATGGPPGRYRAWRPPIQTPGSPPVSTSSTSLGASAASIARP